jgi:predicted RNA-binding protein with PUA-like domain
MVGFWKARSTAAAALLFAAIKPRYAESFRSSHRRRVANPFLTTLLAAQPKNYFLLKSEPDEFSIEDLQRCQENEWDGVRNFQARNKMRLMKPGDLAFFYHSSCKVPAIVGTMRVLREAMPDPAALDPNHTGYDPKSTPENCRWNIVRVGFESILEHQVTLTRLKELAQEDSVIAEMTLLRQSRLSVHEVTPEQWKRIMELSVDGREEETEVLKSTKGPSKSRKRKETS